MPGPARAGALIYAKDLDRLATFYETILPATRLHASSELIVLESPDIQLVLHAMPPDIASTVIVHSPPVRRERTAIKLFFSVASIGSARAAASRLGGEVFTEAYDGRGFRACNACDPEGNIFQVREWTHPEH
jgi:predicted enzyme related to lactoylglutathione lyase